MSEQDADHTDWEDALWAKQQYDQANHRIAALESELAAIKRECEGLREVVTLDGCPVPMVPARTRVYRIIHDDKDVPRIVPMWTNRRKIIEQSYSTRETAEQALAARDATEGGSDV